MGSLVLLCKDRQIRIWAKTGTWPYCAGMQKQADWKTVRQKTAAKHTQSHVKDGQQAYGLRTNEFYKCLSFTAV